MFGIEEEKFAELSALSIESIVGLLKENKAFLLSQDVEKYARFVSFSNGRLALNFNPGFPRDIIKNLNDAFLKAKYNIAAEKSDEPGEDTLKERQEKLFQSQLVEISSNPILKEIMRQFEGARVVKIEEAP